jgi:hypothetical protein
MMIIGALMVGARAKRVQEIRKQLETGVLTGAQRTQLSRTIKPHIRKALEYLTFMAQNLPGKQHEQVFTVENLKDFIEALLTNFEEKKSARMVKNERAFCIAFMLAQKGISHGADLVKSPTRFFSMTPQFIQPNNAHVLNFIYELLSHQR